MGHTLVQCCTARSENPWGAWSVPKVEGDPNLSQAFHSTRTFYYLQSFQKIAEFPEVQHQV
jgi:hypothetical protein